MSKNILVVDDNEDVTFMLSKILSDNDYLVSTAHSGDIALQIAKEGRFDLVLSDLLMPGLTGIELLKQLLTFDPFIAFVLITVDGSIEKVKEALRCGAFDYLQNPLSSMSSLTLLYVAASVRRGKWLIPAFHGVIDDEFGANAHDDPQNFALQLWASRLQSAIANLGL